MRHPSRIRIVEVESCRANVDSVLDGSPPVVLKRVYRNADSRSRPFGVGTNHSLATLLIGDAPTFSYTDLILADGGRIHYARISPGTGYATAIFEHTGTPTEYQYSRLMWNGGGWIIQLKNGALYRYPECPPVLNKPCSVSEYQDQEGRKTVMTHDRRMNLIKVESSTHETLDFAYDDHDRIIRVIDKQGRIVRYEYDPHGRLVRVLAPDGAIQEYGYDDHHQMTFVREPGVEVHNTFDSSGRCTVNDVRLKAVA
jgi:YD repeat-containing protein